MRTPHLRETVDSGEVSFRVVATAEPGDGRRGAGAPQVRSSKRTALAGARRHVSSGSDLRTASAPARLQTLPAALTSFVGRVDELAAIQESLRSARLLTLTGPGGVGKTRLALEVVGRLQRGVHPYTGGIWEVELAQLAAEALVPRALASGFGVREVPGRPPLETVIQWVDAQTLLLILDNCEHVVAGCAAAADALLGASPGMTILATSREALKVAGEVVWPIGPLAADSDGFEMFAQRARTASFSFEVTSDNQPSIVRICRQLDGLPLAIELAAARTNAFTVEEIEQRLDQRFAWLTAGRRSSPARHQTLRALVDWSYDLLSTEEQTLLQQLSVFVGGWTLAAAEAVCEPTADVARLLASLIDKSLVQVEQRAGQSRYRLLETLRHYALEKLRESHLERAVRTRHLVWFESFGRSVELEVLGPRHRMWFQILEVELGNLRSALEWSLLEPTVREAGMRLAALLARFWFVDGYGDECGEWLQKLLMRAAPGPARVEALSANGFLLMRRGDPGAARPLLEEAVTLARLLDDGSLLMFALNYLGQVHVQEGNLAGARSALEEGLALAEQGASLPYWPRNRALYDFGELAEAHGDWSAALSFYERSLKLAREQGDGWRSVVLRRLGQVALNRGDVAAAHDALTESLEVASDWGQPGWSIAPTLAHMASLAVAKAEPDRALRLAAAAVALREKYQARLPLRDTARLEAGISYARGVLGEVDAADAWAAGYAMPADQAVAYALESTPTAAVVTGVRLTPRETEVAALLVRFATNREIADQLVISESTAKRHVENILLKLGLRSRVQVAEWATKRGFASVS